MKRVPLLFVLLLAWAPPLHAQRVTSVPLPQTAVLPDSINVGDVFHAAIRVQVPARGRVLFPDTLPVPQDVEAAGRRQIRIDTTAGGLQFTALYPLAAWRPDSVLLPASEVRVLIETGEENLPAEFRPFQIRSVLPADTAGVEPQPLKDVLGANRLWWPFLLALALLLAAVVIAYWLYQRRRPKTLAAPVTIVSPRERALQALDAARAAGLLETGELKQFYSAVSDAVRQYLDTLEPRWGADLTTSEVAGRMRGHARDIDVAEVMALLGEADLVKFARRRVSTEEALARWNQTRSWVEQFEWPYPQPEARAA